MSISLRGRLALWYLLAVPALVFGLVFTAQEIMVVSIRSELDRGLQDRAEATALAISSIISVNPFTYHEALDQLTEDQLPSIPLLLRVTNASGQTLARFGNVPDPILPHLDRRLTAATPGQGEFFTIEVRGEESLRVYTVALPTQAGCDPVVIIQTGDSLASLAAAQGRLRLYSLGIGVAGTVTILSVGFVILQRGFRPLDRILSRVQEVSHGDLHAMLPAEPRPPELQQLANSLNQMWRRLDEAFQAREAFFASISHDLRTPLTNLQGQIDVMSMDLSSHGPQIQDSLARVSREVRRLVQMTDNLLLNAQLMSNSELRFTEVNLRELLEDVLSDIWHFTRDLELDLPVDQDIQVSGDYDLLKQMVLNIMDNAIKYSPPGQPIKLSLREAGNWGVIAVSDSGVGIASADLPFVTEPFYRGASSRPTPARGSGLGLAIVQRIIDLHQGKIDIQSQEGVGTTVTVSLPVMFVSTGAEPEANPADPGLSRPSTPARINSSVLESTASGDI